MAAVFWQVVLLLLAVFFLSEASCLALVLIYGLLTLDPLANKTVRRARDIGLVTYPLYLLHSKIGTALMDVAVPEFGWAIEVAETAVFLVFCSWLVSRLGMELIQGPVCRFYRIKISRLVSVHSAVYARDSQK